MIIAKFGGTSVSSKKSIYTIGNIIRNQLHANPVVVVSAVSTITDALLEAMNADQIQKRVILHRIRNIHKELIQDLFSLANQKRMNSFIEELVTQVELKLQINEITKATSDEIVSYGERLSAYIIAEFLTAHSLPAQQIFASECIVTNNNFGSAEFISHLSKRKTKKTLTPLIKNRIVPVITGFTGATKEGKITTLGRGGSDYSASIIGFCLHADEIQIWTDVDGVYSADPRMVKSAQLLHEISYKEASELAVFGAKVLHPRTIRPAVSAGIPVRVLNTFHPDHPGTLITDTTVPTGAKAITSKKKVPLMNVYSTDMLLSKGFLKKIFEVFSIHNISVNLVSVSEVSVSITLDTEENIIPAMKELSRFTSVSCIDDSGMVSLIGENIINTPRLMARIFTLFDKEKIPVQMISYGVTNINISFIMPSNKIEKAVKILHDKIILNKKQIVSL